MASFVSLPINKFSHATNLRYEDPIEWSHLQSPDMFVVFDDSSFSSQSSQGYFQGRRMKVIRGIDVLELLNIEELASRAARWLEEANRCGREVEYRQSPIAGVIRCPNVALWYHLPDGKIRRIQMRLSDEKHFESAVSVLQTLRCPLKVAATQQTSAAQTNYAIPSSTVSHQQCPALERSHSHYYDRNGLASRVDTDNDSGQALHAQSLHRESRQPTTTVYLDPHTESTYHTTNSEYSCLALRNKQEQKYPMTPPQSRGTHTSGQSPLCAPNARELLPPPRALTSYENGQFRDGMSKLEHMVTEVNPLRLPTHSIHPRSQTMDYNAGQPTSGFSALEQSQSFLTASIGSTVNSALEIPPRELVAQNSIGGRSLSYSQCPTLSVYGNNRGRPSSALPALERSPLPQPRLKLNRSVAHELGEPLEARMTADRTKQTPIDLSTFPPPHDDVLHEQRSQKQGASEQPHDKRPATAPAKNSTSRNKKRKVQAIVEKVDCQALLLDAERKLERIKKQKASDASIQSNLKPQDSRTGKQTNTIHKNVILPQDREHDHISDENEPQAAIKKKRRPPSQAVTPEVQAEIDKWKTRDAAEAATAKPELELGGNKASQPRRPLSELSLNINTEGPLTRQRTSLLSRVAQSKDTQNSVGVGSGPDIKNKSLQSNSISEHDKRSSAYDPDAPQTHSLPDRSDEAKTKLSTLEATDSKSSRNSSVPSASRASEPTITSTTRAIATALMFINPARPPPDLTAHLNFDAAKHSTQSGHPQPLETNSSDKQDTLSVPSSMLHILGKRSMLLPLQIFLSRLPEDPAARRAAMEELIFSISNEPDFLGFCNELEELWREANIVSEDGKTVAPACTREYHEACAEEVETEEEL